MGIRMKLAIRSLQKNKGRTMVTLFGIVLSVLLVCTVFTLLNSMLCSAIDSITAKAGDWHIAVYNATEKEALEYKEIDGVERVEIVVVNGQETCRLTLKNPKDVYSFAEHYFEGQVEYAYHTELLSYLGVSQRDNVKDLILGVAIALLFIISIGGVSLIYNAFAISVSERTREIGLLSSIGATKQDIGAIIYSEALLLATAAIPFGIGLGVFVSWTMLDVFYACLEKILYVDLDMKLHLNVGLMLLTAAIAYLLVFLSAGIPARRASQIPIIDNLKGANEPFKVTCGNDREPIEVLLAKRNRKRERKAFRAIAFSLAISIFLFVSANAFGIYMLSFIKAEQANIGYDLRMRYSLELGEEGFDDLYDFISTQEGIDELGWFGENTKNHSALLHASWVTDRYRNSSSAAMKEDTEYYKCPLFVFIISDERYEEFLAKNGLEQGTTMYASAFYEEIDTEGKAVQYSLLESGSYQVDVRYMSEAAKEQLSKDIQNDPMGPLITRTIMICFTAFPSQLEIMKFPLNFEQTRMV